MPVAVSGILGYTLEALLEAEPLFNFSIVEAPYDELIQFLNDHMRIVVNQNHPLVDAKKITFEELLSWQWVFPPKETPVYGLLVSEFRRRGFALPTRRAEALSLSLLVSLVENSQFVTALPSSMFRLNRTHQNLVALDVDLRNTENPIDCGAPS